MPSLSKGDPKMSHRKTSNKTETARSQVFPVLLGPKAEPLARQNEDIVVTDIKHVGWGKSARYGRGTSAASDLQADYKCGPACTSFYGGSGGTAAA